MPDMYEIYRRHRAEYDRLVAAEDHSRNLSARISSLLDWNGLRIVEAGAGTGRFTELFAPAAESIACFDREAHMLEAARARLAAFGPKISFSVADNLDLPPLEPRGDAFVEGWSWGHAVVDGSGSVASISDRLFENALRTVRPGAWILLAETLGTNADQPAPPHPRLAEWYVRLQSVHGLAPFAVPTDYRFPDLSSAAQTLGFFFGDDMRNSVVKRGSPVVPEWTGLWFGKLPR